MSGAVLNVEHVSLTFQGVQALSDVSFSIAQGAFCSLIGPNGAGKSSLLNVLSGIYRPQAGRIQFAGHNRAFMDPRWAAQNGLARTFQNIALFKQMSVLDNLLTGCALATHATFVEHALHLGRARSDERVHRERARYILALLEIEQYAEVRVASLPYGLQKRVELGRALAAEPQLLLLDEPLAGMNHQEKQDMMRFVLDLNQEHGTTILLIEHDMGVVMDVSEQVVVLDYGRKIADGTPDQVRRDARVIKAYLGTDPSDTSAVDGVAATSAQSSAA